MKLVVTILDTETGESAESFQGCHYSEEGAEYIWNEGNDSCDCIRAVMLARALGRPEPELSCGDGRFIVTKATLDGKPFPDIVDVAYRDKA